jgi:membrane-associated protein
MSHILELFQHLTDPQWIMLYGGLYFVMLIVFAETGLFVGFFLPGDPLLFITGMIIANTMEPTATPLLNLLYWILLIAAAGIAGNYLGYWFGKRYGSGLFQKKDSLLFKKKYLYQAKEFFEKKGGGAIVLARFLPVVRTFAPIIAGMVGMDRKKFSFYNILGSFCWAGSIISAGFLLGDNAWVKDNLEVIILGIIGLATAPVIIKMIPWKKSSKTALPVTADIKKTDRNPRRVEDRAA